jgi:hypothetical protein
MYSMSCELALVAGRLCDSPGCARWQSAKIEAGAVHLPRQAPWLDDLKAELLAFPHGPHDDQVDAIAQALAWADRPQVPVAAVGWYNRV